MEDRQNGCCERVCEDCVKLPRQRRPSIIEFGTPYSIPWTCVLGPSPPEEPLADNVKLALTSSLICLDISHWCFAAQQRQTYVCGPCSREEEHNEKDKRQVPGMIGMSYSSKSRDDDAGGGKRLLAIRAIDKRSRRGDRKDGLHDVSGYV